MKFSKHLMVVLVLVVLCSALAGCAGASGGAAPADSKADPLFINMTTDDPHRANMALSFGMKQLDLGHPLTVFLNDKGVFVGSTSAPSTFVQAAALITTSGRKSTTCSTIAGWVISTSGKSKASICLPASRSISARPSCPRNPSMTMRSGS